MFSGIGGFDLAMRNLGHEIVGACEIDKYARQIYAKQFPGVPIHDDATQVQAESLPQFDVLCGGFPCQAFSIAGKRKGFSDTRGSLFFEIARIAKEKRPSILFLENVKGLLNHDKGETFRTILSSLDEVGYDVEWQLHNSKFAVAQNRERVYIVGHLRGQRSRQVFPLGNIDSKSDKSIKQIGIKYNLKSDRQAERVYEDDGLAPTLGHGNATSQPFIAVVNDRNGLREVERATCLDANYFKGHDYHGARTLIYKLVREPKLLGNIPIPFMKRRNEPKKSDICDYLRNNKDITMDDLALEAQINKTQLEHYFRKDSSGALPNKDDWLKLKKVLNFDDTYDEIMTDYMEDLMTYEMTTRVYDPTGISPTLTSGEKLITVEPELKKLGQLTPHNGTSVYDTSGISPTLISSEGSGSIVKIAEEPKKVVALTERRTDEAKAIRKKKMEEEGIDWSPRRGKELVARDDNLANCVTTGQTKESLVTDGKKIRKLTPVECERLQGFPDGWTEGISDTQRYKCCGNAVTVPVVQWIASHFEFPKDLA